MHLAARRGNTDLIRGLINRGATLNTRDLFGKTPFQYAIEAGSQEIISLLLAAGAERNLPADWKLQGSYETDDQQMVLTISDTPGRLQQERDLQAQWRITNATWSEGLNGQITLSLVLQHSDNQIPLTVEMTILTESPTLKQYV